MVVCLLGLAGPLSAQTESVDDTVSFQTRKISELTRSFATGEADLSVIEQALLTHESEIVSTEAVLTERADTIRETLERLGPKLDGEAASVTAEREDFRAELAELKQGLSQTSQNLAQIDRLTQEVEAVRRSDFYSDLTQSAPMLLHPETWAEGGRSLVNNFGRLYTDLSAHLQDEETGEFTLEANLALIAALAVAILLAIPARIWLVRNLIFPLGKAGYGSSLDVVIGLFRAALRTLPFILAVILLATTVEALDLVPVSLATVMDAFWLSAIWVAATASLCSVFFSVSTPLFPFNFSDQKRAALLWTFVVGAAFLIGLDHVIRIETNVFGKVRELDVLMRGSVAIMLSVLILLIVRAWSFPEGEKDLTQRESSIFKGALRLPGAVRVVLSVLACACILGALIGYSSLAHFTTTRLFLVGGLTLDAFIFRDALVQLSTAFTHFLFAKTKAEENKSDQLQFWLSVLSTILAFALWVPLALLLIGFEWSSVQRVIMQAITGFQIGSVNFSLAQVAIAVATFFVLIGVTRLVQTTTQSRVFSRLRIDPGVQNSLRTLIGYVGLVIAFFTGVSLLGFDLSNLAIIAGALSVGIGFGLQSIVNNFVSGLILLFERPIKIGDWVVTSSGEGIVKKISVRSTEIETFDRSSVLVPNSELISNSVTNWTHKSRLGRVTIPVGVAYKEDPEQIIEILSKVPAQFDKALTFPEPQVLFTSFGASSLDFELRFFIPDIMETMIIRTQARIAVLKAFREAGIEIPFPQRDIHIQPADMDLLNKHMLKNEE